MNNAGSERSCRKRPAYLCLTQGFPNVLDQRAPLSSTGVHGGTESDAPLYAK